MKNNCPNCGAPYHGDRCKYCDTQFDTPHKSNLIVIQRKLSAIQYAIMAEKLYSDAINEIGGIKPIFPNQILAIQETR